MRRKISVAKPEQKDEKSDDELWSCSRLNGMSKGSIGDEKKKEKTKWGISRYR